MVTLDGVDLKLKQFDASTLFFEVFGTARQVNFHATEQYLLVGEVQLFKRSAEVWYVISLFFHRIFPQNVFAFRAQFTHALINDLPTSTPVKNLQRKRTKFA